MKNIFRNVRDRDTQKAGLYSAFGKLIFVKLAFEVSEN